MDVTHWREQEEAAEADGNRVEAEAAPAHDLDPEMEAFRRRLEGLL
jgi:hypothetical protein